MNAELCKILVACLLCAPLAAQQSLESDYRTTGREVTVAFEAQRAVLQTSSAVILDGRKEINYGVVVSADGHILTKASEIEGVKKPAVIVDRAKFSEVKIVASDPQWDVALLKVDAAGLTPVVYADNSELPQGSWVVANGVTSLRGRRALAGVISAKSREIPAAGGAALGIVLTGNPKHLEIDEVSEGGGAHAAGLRKGDIILSIDGKRVAKIEDIAATLKDRKTGESVTLRYRRDRKEFSAEVRLSAKNEMFGDMMNRNDIMSGYFSKRRSGFPRIIQHDILGSSRVTGGPLLDLGGRCVGMNIARANRAESFAIPVEELRELTARLMRQAAAAEN